MYEYNLCGVWIRVFFYFFSTNFNVFATKPFVGLHSRVKQRTACFVLCVSAQESCKNKTFGRNAKDEIADQQHTGNKTEVSQPVPQLVLCKGKQNKLIQFVLMAAVAFSDETIGDKGWNEAKKHTNITKCSFIASAFSLCRQCNTMDIALGFAKTGRWINARAKPNTTLSRTAHKNGHHKSLHKHHHLEENCIRLHPPGHAPCPVLDAHATMHFVRCAQVVFHSFVGTEQRQTLALGIFLGNRTEGHTRRPERRIDCAPNGSHQGVLDRLPSESNHECIDKFCSAPGAETRKEEIAIAWVCQAGSGEIKFRTWNRNIHQDVCAHHPLASCFASTPQQWPGVRRLCHRLAFRDPLHVAWSSWTVMKALARVGFWRGTYAQHTSKGLCMFFE